MTWPVELQRDVEQRAAGRCEYLEEPAIWEEFHHVFLIESMYQLQAPDPDVAMDLASVVATVFDRGRYGRKLRYGSPLTASLATADLAWAVDVVKAAKKTER